MLYSVMFSLQTKRAVYLFNEKSFSTKAYRIHIHIMPFDIQGSLTFVFVLSS